jgi:hypothetical protein
VATRDNDLIAELNDLRYLEETDARLAVDPLTPGGTCLKPSDLRLLASGRDVPGADEHLPACTYCQRSLAALRVATTAGPESLVSDSATPDLTAAWVEGDAPTGRSEPSPARRELMSKETESSKAVKNRSEGCDRRLM